MVPFYLLSYESNQYPTYIDNSNIDKSLTDDQEFSIQNVNLIMSDSILQAVEMDYNRVAAHNRTVFQNRDGASRSEGYRRNDGEKNVTFNKRPEQNPEVEMNTSIALTDISLLTTADQLIKLCQRKVEQDLMQKFDKPNRVQILKFKNVDSYLYGET